jgi:hypothetical protein
MDCNISNLHQSHSKLKERFGQMNQVVNLPPFNISNLELQVFIIAAIFIDYTS